MAAEEVAAGEAHTTVAAEVPPRAVAAEVPRAAAEVVPELAVAEHQAAQRTSRGG